MDAPSPNSAQEWQVYIIITARERLYTGITTDIERRWQAHLQGKGAKFFRGDKPRRIVYMEGGHNRSSASKRECQIKQLKRSQKLALIAEKQPS